MDESVGKYLTFSVAEGLYGVPISKVREVIRHERITAVHDASAFMKGVINLRGKIIPIIDMRAKFGIQEREYGDRTVFIIFDVGAGREAFSLGAAVDSVHDVTNIPDTDIESAPDVGLKLRSSFISGIAKSRDGMLMILNMDKILSSDEIVDLGQAVTAEKPTGAAPAS
jgi:purine-binding chemotaxis protein CheW